MKRQLKVLSSVPFYLMGVPLFAILIKTEKSPAFDPALPTRTLVLPWIMDAVKRLPS
jgi:hypothetical protein